MRHGENVRFGIVMLVVGFTLIILAGVLGTVRAGDSTIFPNPTQSAGSNP